MSTSLWKLSAAQIVASVQAGDVSPVEVVEAVLDHKEEVEPHVHAFCASDAEAAVQAARGLERRIAKREPVGALAGVPYHVKDLIFTKDFRTTGGTPAYATFVPEEDDIVIERAKAADAILLGKTNTSELGYSGEGRNPLFETSRNPWDLERTPGGSSAGAAAAVAAGVGPVGIGSDGGGSVRIPASFSGLYGIKPSMGRIPMYPGCRDERYPGFSSWETLEHIGPLARTVEDAALVLAAVTGPDGRDRHSLPQADFDWVRCTRDPDIGGLRVAYTLDWGHAKVDAEVRAVVEQAIRVFDAVLGCQVEEATPEFDDPFSAFWGTVIADTDLVGMRKLVEQYGDRMSPGLVASIQTEWTAEQLTDAAMQRKAVCNKLARFMARFDLLLTPTVAVPAFGAEERCAALINGVQAEPSDWAPFTFPFNLSGQPAASVPAGWTGKGLPVGLQIVGRRLSDDVVLQASAAFEAAAPWAARWPPLIESANHG